MTLKSKGSSDCEHHYDNQLLFSSSTQSVNLDRDVFMDVWWNILSEASMDRAHKTLWDKQTKHKLFKMNVKLIFSLSLWYPNEKGETLIVQSETGDRIRLLPSCLPPGEWKWTGKCNHLPTVLNHKAHCLQLGPMSAAGHHYVCLLPHPASKSLRV